jgi:hypothetical protein
MTIRKFSLFAAVVAAAGIVGRAPRNFLPAAPFYHKRPIEISRVNENLVGPHM